MARAKKCRTCSGSGQIDVMDNPSARRRAQGLPKGGVLAGQTALCTDCLGSGTA